MAYVMRPARRDELGVMMELARLSGPGFTSLPMDETILQERLDKSEAAFARTVAEPLTGKFLMLMENTDTGEVVGCSAVKAGTGVDQPFFNYRIITLAHSSVQGDRRFDMDALVLTNEFVGYTEVGTLFLKDGHRGGGNGRLAAQARYLLMAAAPDMVSDMVLAELRGVVTPEGHAPFWEHLGAHFFRMSFQEADYLSATTDNQFILDLMPKYPIYVDLLPPEAREVIGRCHADGVGAMKLLEWEGFRFERVVDIFDGGPMVATHRGLIRTLRESRLARLVPGEVGEAEGHFTLVSNDRLPDFRVTACAARWDEAGRELFVSGSVLDVLRMRAGETARVWMRMA
jgi:arginine N-succinyltransferase